MISLTLQLGETEMPKSYRDQGLQAHSLGTVSTSVTFLPDGLTKRLDKLKPFSSLSMILRQLLAKSTQQWATFDRLLANKRLTAFLWSSFSEQFTLNLVEYQLHN